MTESRDNETTKEMMDTEAPRKDKSYDPQSFEKKWQEKWEADKLYRAVIDESIPEGEMRVTVFFLKRHRNC